MFIVCIVAAINEEPNKFLLKLPLAISVVNYKGPKIDFSPYLLRNLLLYSYGLKFVSITFIHSKGFTYIKKLFVEMEKEQLPTIL